MPRLAGEESKRGLSPLINSSFEAGVLQAPSKEAVIRALLKKPSLDLAELGHYCPVSNLPFLGTPNSPFTYHLLLRRQ